MIDVKNSQDQDVSIVNDDELQEIEVVNEDDQEIDITEEDNSQEIDVSNDVDQEIEVQQDIEIIKVYDHLPQYEGEYKVTPKITDQTLPTAQKFLQEDVKVEKIPYFEVSNNSGGMTASIGEV